MRILDLKEFMDNLTIIEDREIEEIEMKNKEKIQILENRLNIQSKLLDKIITKLELDNEPQLKQLDQSVFDGLDSKWIFAAIDKNGNTWVYTHKPDKDSNYWYVDEPEGREIGEGYDTTNWQTSLIKRETIELTGSELCKAMLARGDTRIMCLVTDEGSRDDITHVIRVYEDGRFHTKANSWKYAVPINNHGEPLTSKDVGL